jgi:hypothetical protein
MTTSLTPGCHRPRRHPGRSHDPAGRGRLGYKLCKRTQAEPLKATRLLVLALRFTVLGVTDLTSSAAPDLNPTPAIVA